MDKKDVVQKNMEGVELYRKEKYEEALSKFNEAMEIDAEYPAPWLNRSDAYRKLGREAEADADIKKWKSLKKAVPAEKRTRRSETEDSGAIIEMRAGENFIMAAVVAGALSGVVTLVLSIIGALGFTLWNLIDAFVVLGLTFGVYKKSRVCAIALFVLYIGPRIWMMVTQPESIVIWSSLPMSILFGTFYFLGIRGTFAYHRVSKWRKQNLGIAVGKSPKP
jgi:tetratricopeptide (TPR) repeat protein